MMKRICVIFFSLALLAVPVYALAVNAGADTETATVAHELSKGGNSGNDDYVGECERRCVLTITKEVDQESVASGTLLAYTLRFQNTGNADCTGGGVKVEDRVDPLLAVTSEAHSDNVDAGYGGPLYATSSRILAWNAHTLSPGESGWVRWNALVSEPSMCGPFDIANTGRITSREYDNFSSWVESNTVHSRGEKACEENNPPVFDAIPPIEVFAGEQMEFIVNATDSDGDALVYAATSTPNGSAFDPETRTFSWTPFAKDVGDHSIEFTATDGEAAATTTAHISVVLATPICSASGLFGTYYNLPSGHPDVEGPITGIVSGTTPFDRDWYADGYLSFTRNDGLSALNIPQDFFPVNEGLAEDPFYFSAHWKGSVNAPEAGHYSFALGSDDDSWLYINGAQEMDYGGVHPFGTTSTSVFLSAGTSTIDLYFAERHKVQSGILFSADDRLLFSPCVSGEEPVNHPPVFSGPVYASGTVSMTITFAVTAADPDGDTLTITAQIPEGASYETSTGAFSWVPDRTGTSTAQFFAFDGAVTSTHEVVLEVFAQPTSTENLPPAFANFNPPVSATATMPYAYDVDAVDPENDPLIFALVEFPSGMAINASTGLIQWIPTAEQATSTSYAVTVVVSDALHTASTTYALFVGSHATSSESGGNTSGGNTPTGNTGGNSGVVLVGGGGSTSGGGGGSGYAPTQNLPPYFVDFDPPRTATATWLYLYDVNARDPEDQPISYSLLESPLGMSIIHLTGFIVWRPAAEQINTAPYTVVVQASDGVHATSTRYSIVVNAPAIYAAPLQPNIEDNEEVIEEGTEGAFEAPPASSTENISLTTTTTPTTTSAGGRTFGALLFAGLFSPFGKAAGWIFAHWCILSFIAWILTLIAFLLYVLFERRREKRHEVVQGLPSITYGASAHAPPLFGDVPIFPEEA